MPKGKTSGSISEATHFRRDDWVVFPAHGPGRVVSVRQEMHQGESIKVLEVDFQNDRMRMIIPVTQMQEIGVRHLSTPSEIRNAMETLGKPAKVVKTMWNRRALAYETKLRSGNLVSVAEVIRDLHRKDIQQEQSYSERRLYEDALRRMGQEIGAAQKITDEDAVDQLRQILEQTNANDIVSGEEQS